MNTIVNTALVTDYSGEPPIVNYSNPITTVIRQPPPATRITRVFYCLPCNCCNCACNCQCDFCCNNCCCNNN